MNRIGKILIIAVVIIAALIYQFLSLYTDWAWYASVGFGDIFTKTLYYKIITALAFTVTVFLIVYINLSISHRLLRRQRHIYTPEEEELIYRRFSYTDILAEFADSPYAKKIIFWGSLLISLIPGINAAQHWQSFALFLHGNSFALTDPILNQDAGYYVFRLPFLNLAYNTVFGVLVLSLAVIGVSYYLIGILQKFGSDVESRRTFDSAIRHLSLTGAIALLVRAYGYKLSIDYLLYSPRGVTFGASYTDVYATKPVTYIAMAVAVFGALLFLANIKLRKTRILIAVPGVLMIVSLVIGTAYPAIIQQFIVTPNELESESEFIKYNIDFTREAYNLTKISEEQYPTSKILTREDIEANAPTIENIRIHDMIPALDTYNQIEAIRPYYDFLDVDIDRYMIDGKMRQVMVSAREIIPEKMPTSARTWINYHLKYTHGQGIIMSPVNEISSQGQPEFFINQIPPKAKYESLRIDRPQIYYGEHKGLDYIITNTRTAEIDYTSPSGPVDYFYEGKGGIKLNMLNKMLYSIKLGTAKLFLNQDITPESQLLLHRNIMERVELIAPFLEFDSDPYIVLHERKLYWIVDGYTYSYNFPYAEPYRQGINYIRNSVKVVIDAYDGSMDFYLFDEEDPIVKTYSQIYPTLFKSFTEMPEGLKKHMRYPETLFKIQAEMLLHYHMTDVGNFFSKDDAWSIPYEIFGQTTQVPVEPRYIIMSLPGEDPENIEFILMLPFTPLGKNNMIAWLAARMDGNHYGELKLYQFSRQEFVNGPLNIENRIDQDPEISSKLSLWSQLGSNVIRSNLMVIPINDSLLFIEPIYLQASAEGLPEIRRIVIAHGDQVVMEETFDKALDALFGSATKREPGAPPVEDPGEQTEDLNQLVIRAQELYEKMEKALQDIDWARYGELQKELKDVIDTIANITKITTSSE